MKTIKVGSKKVDIYDKYDGENKLLPIIVYNSFGGNAEDVFNDCLKMTNKEFIFVVIENIDWDNEMTPYPNPPIFKGDSEYLGLAPKHLEFIENEVINKVNKELLCMPKEYIMSGYSLGGLFTIYSILHTKIFTKFVSCSGSLWYPNFIEYFKKQKIDSNIKVYLSLGNKEKSCRDISKCVEDKTNELYDYLKDNNIDTTFELNEGNHFKDASLRMAKGIKWILN